MRAATTQWRGGEENVLTEAHTRGFSFDVRNQEMTAFATLYATDIGHRAYENGERKQGYFTSALVEGLKGGTCRFTLIGMDMPEAWMFLTGLNEWRKLDAWPPKGVQPKTLYVKTAAFFREQIQFSCDIPHRCDDRND